MAHPMLSFYFHVVGIAAFVFCVLFTVLTAFVPRDGFGQSPRSSLAEAWVNIAIGFTINFVVNLAIIPAMTNGGAMSALDNFCGGWIYTSVSMIRQYAIRRWFNARLQRILARL